MNSTNTKSANSPNVQNRRKQPKELSTFDQRKEHHAAASFSAYEQPVAALEKLSAQNLHARREDFAV
jgi:hypothetical protein